jgi:hypothetical protein
MPRLTGSQVYALDGINPGNNPQRQIKVKVARAPRRRSLGRDGEVERRDVIAAAA